MYASGTWRLRPFFNVLWIVIFIALICKYFICYLLVSRDTHFLLASFLDIPSLKTGNECLDTFSKVRLHIFQRIGYWSPR